MLKMQGSRDRQWMSYDDHVFEVVSDETKAVEVIDQNLRVLADGQ